MKTPTPEIGTPTVDPKFRIKIVDHGPYLVFGFPPIRTQTIMPNEDGNSWELLAGDKNYTLDTEPTALCRCGHSKNPPYCDGSHLKTDWDATLTAPRTAPLDEAEVIRGQTLTLTDAERYCAFARFCDAKGRTWNQVEDSGDPHTRSLAIRTSSACPAGRLKAFDNRTEEPFEPTYTPQIGLLEDPAIKCSAGLFVMGGIPVEAPDGFVYIPRNRVTLCRCGNSSNKPFCDGTHASSHYRDRINQ